jgi:hypothetical protein
MRKARGVPIMTAPSSLDSSINPFRLPVWMPSGRNLYQGSSSSQEITTAILQSASASRVPRESLVAGRTAANPGTLYAKRRPSECTPLTETPTIRS